MKNKRVDKIVNGSPSSNLLHQSKVYMGRKIAASYSTQGAVSNKRVKSDSGGCGCGKPKQIGVKSKY
ncbi:hypothetical protein [Bacillus sp. MRMR6]|uniref:hypothetical protein n=1 Tax=Bacillus sp. MRMR6 TaxID=1928617 RepID=UPI000950E507|nr:hypothetical protein [Bacillus sp. MRMR6]OLS34069.1 hypothetical protein BTR25_23250 [Bacillus sp. MRMR6]